MSKKITFKKLNVPNMTIESWKEKIPTHIQQVEKNPSGDYKITFRKSEHPGYIRTEEDKVRFIHYCEANAKGQSCAHVALALATADLLGQKIDLIGFPTSPITIPEMETDLEDVSESIGVIPPVKPSATATPSATAGISAPAAAPAKPVSPPSKRDWKDGWNEIQEYLQDQGITPRVIMEIRQCRERICDTVEMTTMAVFPKKPKTPYMGEMLGRTLRHILMGKDLLLVGDKGSGSVKRSAITE